MSFGRRLLLILVFDIWQIGLIVWLSFVFFSFFYQLAQTLEGWSSCLGWQGKTKTRLSIQEYVGHQAWQGTMVDS